MVLPYSASRALNPRSVGCEIIIAADAAADVVFVVFGVESVVRSPVWGLDADFLRFAGFASAFGHGLRVDVSLNVNGKSSGEWQ